MASANPVQYAEETLGVHAVWAEAQERLSAHKAASTERTILLAILRANRDAQATREAEIVAEATGKYNEMSDTARNKIFKELIRDDADHQKLKSVERDTQGKLDVVDADLNHHEKGLGVLGNRMVELGGLLSFYAACKIESLNQTQA